MAYIYLIHQTGSDAYKIGVSADPKARLRSLQTGNPSKLTLIHVKEVSDQYSVLTEQAIHKALAFLRLEGEWFYIPPAVFGVDFLERLKTSFMSLDINSTCRPSLEDPRVLKAVEFIEKTEELPMKDVPTVAACTLIKRLLDLPEYTQGLGCFGSTSPFVSTLHKGGLIEDRSRASWFPYLDALETQGLIQIDLESNTVSL